MSPFVEVEVNDRKYRTQTVDCGHKNPVWNKTLIIPVLSMGDSVHISCHNTENKGQSSGIIGETEIPIYTLCR